MKKNLLIVWLIVGLLGWGALQTFAGGGPCNYIVLYDQNDTNSIAVANYYQQVRSVPERNMVPYTFFPAGKTSFSYTELWDLTLYLRQVIQNRGLTGRFNGIAVAGTVPLIGKTDRLCFQSGLYYAPNLTSSAGYTNYNSNNRAWANPPDQPTREIRDDKPYIAGSITNTYWPISFVGFTGVNGNTPDEVFALLDRSKAADGLRPDGRIYWPTNGDDLRIGTRLYETNAVLPVWNARGIRYLITNPGGATAFNEAGRPDIAGLFIGAAQADIGINGNTYVPGAWADHLTSNGGNLNSLLNGQSSACAWIRSGAYGAAGTCSEPYAIAGKFPHAHIHTHLRAGASQAEAFWQSLQSPHEIVMVGDPLLQAWAQIPQVTITSPADGATLSGAVSINASASTVCPDGLESQYELAIDGHIVRIGATNETISATWTGSGFTLNTATLADGWHDVRVVAYNNNLIHTQGEARRTILVNNSSQSVTLTGPGALEYTSNGTFTVSLNGIANATNVTLQANGRTLATLSTSGGSTNLSAGRFGYKGVTKLYALAWLNNGKQVWSAPLDVSLSWAPAPATNVTPGASIARIRYFSSTTATNFDWDSTTPDAVTNLAGPVLAEGFHTAIEYRAYSVDTNVFAPADYTGKPGFDSTMYFLAPVDGLYEFMVDDTSITNIWMDVDGQRMQHGISTSEGRTKPVPVKLAAGFHPVRLRFQATKSDYLAELFFRGGISPGNMNCAYYSNYLNLRMNEFVCFGPAIESNAAPVITSGPSSTPVATTKAVLSVTASDPDGTNLLTYSWAKIDGPGEMTVYANATSTCFTNLATFTRAGNYRIRVMVSDGLSVATGEVAAVIAPVYSTLSLSPANPTLRTGTSTQLYVTQVDQFGTGFDNRPFVWSVIGNGTVTSNGLYTAPGSPGTNWVVVTVGAISSTNTIIVVDNFAPTISSISVMNYGDHLRCSVTATDDLGTNNLIYTWIPAGVQPGTITFSTNGTAANPVDGYFTRFGTYKIQVGVTDAGGATTWSSTNTITVGPIFLSSALIETNGNNNGRLDLNESADLFVTLYRMNDYGTNLPFSAVLAVTNTPGLTVVQGASAYPINKFISSTSSNLVPFRLSADSGLIDVNPRNLVLTVTIGGASGDLPFSLAAGAPYQVIESSGAAIVPGTNDIGVHDALWGGTNVALPFAYNFGRQSFTNVFVNGSGILQFSSSDIYNYYGMIPETGFTNMIAVHWELLRLNGAGAGIFTSVSGTAPNRIFNIEWRAVRYFDTNHVINCEARLFESEPRVDMIYGTVGNSGADADVGLQISPESYIVYSEYQPVLTNGLQLSFIMKNDTGAPTAGFTASPTSGWAPLAVTFSDASTGGITNRFWDFGDGTTLNTTAMIVSHTYASAGNKTVQLIVSGPDGVNTNTQVDCVQVTTAVAPSAGFTLTPASGTVPLAVSFTDTSTGSITNRFWSFGDGAVTNTTATTVLHTYTSVGTNTVQLIVRGPAGSSTNTQAGAVTVTLPPAPVANFSASPLSGAAPLVVTFTDTSTGTITNRFWSFGDGGTTNTTATSVAHIYAAAGVNTVQLIVSGPGGVSTNTQANRIIATEPAVPAPLNISSAYDYDAVATRAEIDYATGQGKTVYGAIGNHAIRYTNRTTQPQSFGSDPSGTIKGLPADGLIVGGKYELGKGLTDKYGTATGNTKVNNAVGRLQTVGDGIPTRTVTVNLEAADQKKYSNLNILVNGNRYSTRSGVTMAANIEVKYVGDANWYSVWSESVNITAAGTLGGTFGGAMDSTTNGQYYSSAWTPVVATDKGWAKSSATTTMGGGTAYMYELAVPAALIGTKTLESFRLTSTTTEASRYNEFILYAASATAAGGSAPAGDTDSDGIPDEWETQYFGGATNANPSALAANGVNTIYETYIAGLNPTNPASVFLISDFRSLTSGSTLQWQSASGRVYSVYWATNLMNGFQPLETNILWPQNSWTDTVHGAQGGSFYKIDVMLRQ